MQSMPNLREKVHTQNEVDETSTQDDDRPQGEGSHESGSNCTVQRGV
jgi:hypothetical protein